MKNIESPKSELPVELDESTEIINGYSKVFTPVLNGLFKLCGTGLIALSGCTWVVEKLPSTGELNSGIVEGLKGLTSSLEPIPGIVGGIVLFLAPTIGEISGRLLKKVLDKIETRLGSWLEILVDRVIDGIQHSIQLAAWGSPISFKDRYYRYLRDFYCDFDMPGSRVSHDFNCDLNEVFISFSIAYDNYEKTPITPTDEHGLSAVWQSLSIRKKSGRPYKAIMISGNPGSGKTTLLKYILLVCIGSKKPKHVRQFRKLTPILLSIREVFPLILEKKEQLNLVSLIESQDFVQELKPKLNWFESRLKKRECLVMLDGLDEIADEQQQGIVSLWINQQVNSNSGNAFIITSRPFAHRKELIQKISAFLEIRPLNFRQAEKFIMSWYIQNEAGRGNRPKNSKVVEKKASARAIKLIARIKNSPSLLKLTGTPLLLVMIIKVYESGHELPKSRASLYREICKVMLQNRGDEISSKNINLTFDQKLSILQVLALSLVFRKILIFSANQTEKLIRSKLDGFPGGNSVNVQDFLSHIHDTSGLIILSDVPEHYEFNHRCIQEYLAASMVKELRKELLLIDNIHRQWWSETIRLYAAQSNASRIVQKAEELALAPEGNPVAFKLVYDCLIEAKYIDPNLRNRLENSLDIYLESEDIILRSHAAQVKLDRRLERLMQVDRYVEVDSEYLLCCEYQLFVDDQRNFQNKHYQPDHWQDYKFPPNKANEPITGVRAADADDFCKWLTEKHAGTGSRFRLPTASEEEEYCREEFTINRWHGCWCITQEQHEIKGLDHQLVQQWKLNIVQIIRDERLRAEKLARKLNDFSDKTSKIYLNLLNKKSKIFLQQIQQINVSLIHVNFNSAELRSLGLDVYLLNNLINALKIVSEIYQQIQNARREGRGYEIKHERKRILDIAESFEQEIFLKGYKVEEVLLDFEKNLGIQGYDVRNQTLEVMHNLLRALTDIIGLTYKHVLARIRDLKYIQSLIETEHFSSSYDFENCSQIGIEVVKDLKLNSNKKPTLKFATSFTPDDVGFLYTHDEFLAESIDYDFIYNFSRSQLLKPDLDRVQAHLLIAISMWYSLSYIKQMGNSYKTSKQLNHVSKESSATYRSKRDKAAIAYISTLFLKQQLKGLVPSWGGIRIMRERLPE
jgi:hypothetical protein